MTARPGAPPPSLSIHKTADETKKINEKFKVFKKIINFAKNLLPFQ